MIVTDFHSLSHSTSVARADSKNGATLAHLVHNACQERTTGSLAIDWSEGRNGGTGPGREGIRGGKKSESRGVLGDSDMTRRDRELL